MTRKYTVKGAHCGSCMEMIKRTMSKADGVEDMDVSFEDKKISVETNDLYDETAVLAAVSDEGYELQVEE